MLLSSAKTRSQHAEFGEMAEGDARSQRPCWEGLTIRAPPLEQLVGEGIDVGLVEDGRILGSGKIKGQPFFRGIFLPGAPFFRGNFWKGESAQACLFPLEFLETLARANIRSDV